MEAFPVRAFEYQSQKKFVLSGIKYARIRAFEYECTGKFVLSNINQL